MLESRTNANDKDGRSLHVANLMALYRSCARRKHPWSQEMAKRYEQELRQLGVATGSE
jgi:hypothetical protein